MKANHELQHRLQTLLNERITPDKEQGIQVAAYHNGQLILDAWAGWTDISQQVPVNGDTLFPVFSVTKGITSTIVHRLVERGLLDYETPISHYWHEFGCHGKQDITLAQALSHSAGIPQMPHHLRCEDLGNWDQVCTAIANLKPLWPAGTRVEYHAISWGWIVGETACRATGKDFSDLLEEEIKTPLGLRDLHIGCPTEVISRVAVLEETEPQEDLPPSDEPSAIPWWIQPLYQIMNRQELQQSCLPAANGIMSARAIAKVYAALSPKGINGVRLLPPERVKTATRPRLMPDGTVADFALGYLLGSEKPVLGNQITVFGHDGHGGATGFYDPERDLAFGLTHNRLKDPSLSPSVRQIADYVRNQIGKN